MLQLTLNFIEASSLGCLSPVACAAVCAKATQLAASNSKKASVVARMRVHQCPIRAAVDLGTEDRRVPAVCIGLIQSNLSARLHRRPDLVGNIIAARYHAENARQF
jgi:hypothetical protein